MYPVTNDFNNKMKADRRRIKGKIQVDFTDPFLDQSIDVEVNEENNISKPEQTANAVSEPERKWISLDGSWELDGTWYPASASSQVGWWGEQLAGNRVLSFDGIDDYIEVMPDGYGTFNNQSFTIESWVKILSTSDGDRVIFSYDFTSHTSAYYSCHLRIISTQIYLGYNISGVLTSTNAPNYTLKEEHVGEWVHISATFESGSQKIYLNGQEVASTNNVGTILFYNQEVWIGRGNFGGYFRDGLDDVRIWNIAKTQEEIQDSMNKELEGNEVGLVGYWKFNELSGTTALDSTANSNNGTINGATREDAFYELKGQYFTAPYPKLTMTFLSRPIRKLKVYGDNKRGEYPVDFIFKLYDDTDTELHSEVVTNNSDVFWELPITAITGVTKMTIEISKWSHAGRQVKIMELFTSIQETYTGDDIFMIGIQEEREISNGSLPVGNISANEIEIRLNNIDNKFDAGNDQSPIYQLLKANRRIRAWIGAEAMDDNYALSFDGVDDYVNYPTDESPSTALTMEVWVKIDTHSSSSVRFVGGKGSTGGKGFWLGVFSDGLPGFALTTQLKSTTPINLGEWVHIVGVWDGLEQKIYVNGEFKNSVSATTSPIDYTGHSGFRVGDLTGQTERLWHGSIDDVRIWNTARTQAEIQANMNKELIGNETGLVGYWKFNEGSGTTVIDSTSNGNDGTINGAIYTDDTPDIETITNMIWVPMGEFWSGDWQVPENEAWAHTTGRDRMELLRKTTYSTSQVIFDTNLYALAEIVLQDAGLTDTEYWIDPALLDYLIPYAWFNPISHREALRRIAEACIGQVYTDRNGIVRIEGAEFLTIERTTSELEITGDDYFDKDQPVRWSEIANYIEVETAPLRPVSVAEEIYKSNEPENITAGQTKTYTVYYNDSPVIEAVATLEDEVSGSSIDSVTYYAWGASVTVSSSSSGSFNIVISGKPLKVLNKQRAIAQDEASIIDNGVLRFKFPENQLIQKLDIAELIATTLLDSFKDPRRDIEIDWRGNPALLLGDRITIPDFKTNKADFHVVSQSIEFDGGLTSKLKGRRATSNE